MSDVHLYLRGLTADSIAETIERLFVQVARAELERALAAQTADERVSTATALLSVGFVEGVRYTWSELVAQLTEAGVHIHPGGEAN